MAEDKTLLKKDLMLILKLDSKLHYDDITEVKKVHNVIKQKKMFTTSVGQRYERRLEQIIQGENVDKCLFCGKSGVVNSVMCPDCLAKLQPSQTVKTSETTKNSTMTKKENAPQEPKKKDNRKKPKKWAVIAFVVFLMLFAVFSEDAGSVSSYSEFEEFVRDNENIGETITFRAEVVSVFSDKYLIQVREKNTKNLIQIITTPAPGMNFFHGDEIIYTGIYNGRTTDGNRLAFVTVTIELD